jgi:hypothetical protein
VTSARLAAALLALALLAGCGGGGSGDEPIERVPAEGGVRENVRAAQTPAQGEFPQPGGKSLQELADSIGGGPELTRATSIFTSGRENRLAFGVVDDQGQFVYGPTAIYLARSPDAPAQGPFLAPADLLVTDGRYRSRQAASESDFFAAVYASEVEFDRPGTWYVVSVTRNGSGQVAAGSSIDVISSRNDRIPEVGDRVPKVETDTVASAKGDLGAIDTRVPPSDMHERSLTDVLGRKPVALLFSTPQLCQSRVCGPVTDVALQMKAQYGDRMEFIHQEVYEGNDPSRGYREPLRRFNLRTEPWLFVIGRDGRITARLEGSFGLDAFEKAVRTAL